ncbi:MAG: hypothetical protein MI920_10390 [Kiloniellales bacterium]|nr:hypothetical protein [Kiloniellales bacterium]
MRQAPTLSRRSLVAGLALFGLTGCAASLYESDCAAEGHAPGTPGMARCLAEKEAAARRARYRAGRRGPPPR